MPGRAIRVAKSRSFNTLDQVTKSRVFIGCLRYPPIFTEGPENIFSEGLTYRINLVYSQMARGLLSQAGHHSRVEEASFPAQNQAKA
jgi:hypothetical protein